jgi:hypothetical protein
MDLSLVEVNKKKKKKKKMLPYFKASPHKYVHYRHNMYSIGTISESKSHSYFCVLFIIFFYKEFKVVYSPVYHAFDGIKRL